VDTSELAFTIVTAAIGGAGVLGTMLVRSVEASAKADRARLDAVLAQEQLERAAQREERREERKAAAAAAENQRLALQAVRDEISRSNTELLLAIKDRAISQALRAVDEPRRSLTGEEPVYDPPPEVERPSRTPPRQHRADPDKLPTGQGRRAITAAEAEHVLAPRNRR